MKTEEVNMVAEGRRNNPTVYLLNEMKDEESKDDDSSVHNDIWYLSDIAQLFKAKKLPGSNAAQAAIAGK